MVAKPIPDQAAPVGTLYTYTFSSNTFTDSDAAQQLTYAAKGLPAGIAFDTTSRTFLGTPSAVGTFLIELTATDNGLPPIATTKIF